MKFKMRKNGLKMATVRVDFNIGYIELFHATAMLLDCQETRITRSKILEKVKDVVCFHGLDGLYFRGDEDCSEQHDKAHELMSNLFPELEKNN